MRKLIYSIVAAFVILIPSCACEPSPLEDAAPVSGTPPTTSPHLYPMSEVRHDFTPTPPTTSPPLTTTTTHYHPPTTTSPPTTAPASPVAATGDVWWDLAGCETGYKYDNPNTGNGYFGFFQFDLPTWQGVGGPGYPHHHDYSTQLHYAKILQSQRGWEPWPTCARKLGLI